MKTDRASVGPIGLIAVIVSLMAFEAILPGGVEAATQGAPSLIPASFASCSAGGPFGLGGITCYIGTILAFIGNFFIAIIGACVIAYNLISVNITGAPWYVRLVVGTVFTLGLGWSIASLLRGGD